MTIALRDERSLILGAAPAEPVELRTIFSDQPDSIRRRLENPPQFRPNGWGLATGDRARFVAGEFIRVGGFRSVVDLYRDGYLLMGAHINSEFLAWADREDGIRIHPIALIELITNFVRFYQLVLDDFRSRPASVEFRLRVRNMFLGGKKTTLPAGPMMGYLGWIGGRREAPADTWEKSLIKKTDDYGADRIAFQLVRELYVWFGHSEEDIPYTTTLDGATIIDTGAILAMR